MVSTGSSLSGWQYHGTSGGHSGGVCKYHSQMLHQGSKQTSVILQGAWDLAVVGRYFALAALVLCLLALVLVLLRKVALMLRQQSVLCIAYLSPARCRGPIMSAYDVGKMAVAACFCLL